MFDQVIGNKNGLLKDKTRIFVTNAISYLPQVDEILVIKNGIVAEQGSYQELQDAKGPFSEYLKEHMNDDQTIEKNIEKIEDQNNEANQDLSKDKVTGDIVKEPKINIDQNHQKQYEKETMETGRVDFSVYTFYIKSMGLHFFGSSIIFMIIYQVTVPNMTLKVMYIHQNSDPDFSEYL